MLSTGFGKLSQGIVRKNMSDTDMLYIAGLQKKLEESEAKKEEFKQVLRECMRILAVAEFDFPKFSKEADKIYDKIEKMLK